MELVDTAWKGFRNLKPRHQKWCSGLNVLVGPNGSGKTNMLESLNVLCGWGPFPGGRTSSLVAWDAEDGRALLAASADGERDVEVQAAVGARLSLRMNSERATYSMLRSLLPALSFLPGDIDLLDGSPSVRRLFLDRICALLSPLHARRLAEYRQLVRQRTALLRRHFPNQAELRATLPPMAQLGGWIRANRSRIVALFAEMLAEEQGLLPFPLEPVPALQGTARRDFANPEEAIADLTAALTAPETLERERHTRVPPVWPHRDDLIFMCLGRPATLSLSRGQKRRVVAAAILAAGRLIEARMRIRPILLLDDIAAELDADGRRMMGTALGATGWQVFVTGTENPFPETESTVTHIRDGAVV